MPHYYENNLLEEEKPSTTAGASWTEAGAFPSEEEASSTRATVEVYHFFSEIPQFGSLRPLPKTDFGGKKTAAG